MERSSSHTSVQDGPGRALRGVVWASGKTDVGTWCFPLGEVNTRRGGGHSGGSLLSRLEVLRQGLLHARKTRCGVDEFRCRLGTGRSVPACHLLLERVWREGSVAGLRFTSSAFAPQDLFTNWIFYEKGLVW